MLFNFWHEFNVYSFSRGSVITYRVLCARWIDLLTPDQRALGNRVTLALVMLDSVLVSAILTIAYLFLK